MGTFIAMNPFRLRLQCLYVYEAPHLTIESFNIILEACPNLRQVILFLCSSMTSLFIVWQPISMGRQLRGHPADCQNCPKQQLGGGNTLRIALVPVNLCQGRIFWSNMRRRRRWPEYETRSHNPASTVYTSSSANFAV